VGGRPITASQWLRDGDELRVMGTSIRVAWRDGRRALEVKHAPADGPALVVPAPFERASPEADALVRPADFTPRAFAVASGPPARRFPRPPLAAAALGLVALAAGALLFFVRVVEVRVEPEPERMSVQGAPHLAWGATQLLFPGRYTVKAERGGYRPLEAPLEVTGQRNQVATFTLELLPGRVRIDPIPAAGVRVFVDGVERGTTPLPALEIPAGEHEIGLRAEGYAPFATRLTVRGGGQEQAVNARLTVDRAPVTFASEPAAATVSVDGVEVGKTPLTVDLSSGRRAVTVALSGYRPAGRAIDVVAEKPLTVPPFRLEALPARLRLSSEPPGAAVSVDGAFRGETPLELTLAPLRAHALRLTKAGHASSQSSVELGRGEERSLSVVLEARLGDVEVTAEPADAEVVVDGVVQGKVPRTLKLSAAPHEIEVRRSGYESHKATVTPRPDFPQAVKVRLRSLQEPKSATLPQKVTAQGHEMRILPPGRFQMGASRREPGRRGNEVQREVELTRASYLAVREVTNAQFRRFLAAHSSGKLGNHDLDGDQQPVVRVTWEQAAEYCNWLSAQEGRPPVYVKRDGKLVAASPIGVGYRLPTEAEWSRAARYPKGGPLKYPWGEALPVSPGSGNYADESARPVTPQVLQGYDDRFPVTSPVGSFRPNELGLFDLGGNAAEWVHDVYSIPAATTAVEKDPAGPPAGDLHVILGSSYLHGSVGELRLSYRDYSTKPRSDVGFRVARYAE
jgi:formylglycine-generating enzyme required for sulfatase activity